VKNFLSQASTTLNGTINGIGPLGEPTNAENRFAQILSSAIGLITIIAFIWFLFTLITGAIGIIAAGGDKGKLEDARGRITTGLIGLVVVIAGIFIVDLIARILGIPSILNIPAMINLVTPQP
jgi:ABC-type phosphate transport system permease subunit